MNEIPIPKNLRSSHRNWDVAESMIGGDLDDPDLGTHVGLAVNPSGNSKKWAAALRDNTKLKYLAVWTGRSSQDLLESIVTIKTLERLEFGILQAADISGLAKLVQLQYLSIVSLSSANTLKPITRLKNLISLGIGISRKISSLEVFFQNSLDNLRALHLGESSEQVVTLDSLKPLGALPSLEYLALGRIRSEDKSLAALLGLPRLKALEIDKNARFCNEDIASLRSKGVAVSTF